MRSGSGFIFSIVFHELLVFLLTQLSGYRIFGLAKGLVVGGKIKTQWEDIGDV